MIGFERFKELLPKRKTREELDAYSEGIELEKGDIPAMIIAALITFIPVLIVAMVVIYGFIWLLMIR